MAILTLKFGVVVVEVLFPLCSVEFTHVPHKQVIIVVTAKPVHTQKREVNSTFKETRGFWLLVKHRPRWKLCSAASWRSSGGCFFFLLHARWPAAVLQSAEPKMNEKSDWTSKEHHQEGNRTQTNQDKLSVRNWETLQMADVHQPDRGDCGSDGS